MEQTSERPIAHQPMLYACAAVSCGIVFDRYFDFDFQWYVLSALAAGIIWALFASFKSKLKSVILFFGLLAIVGGGWHHWHWNFFQRTTSAESQPRIQLPFALKRS